MVQTVTIWHGTDQQLADLRHAVSANCECTDGQPMCAAHALLCDQRILDHMAFVASHLTDFIQEEFDPDCGWP